MTRSDADPDDDEAPVLHHGHVELIDEDDHTPHGAGWLYLPDLASESGFVSHRVPGRAPAQPKKRLGFTP